LAPQDLQVLLALAEAPRHAYALADAVEATSGSVRLELGSLYRVLARMTTIGVIEAFDPPARARGHEARRRYYRITTFGRRVAEAEISRLHAVIRQAARQKIAPEGGRR
jgi:DNA-binding PadR family transcriptional regulator